MHFLLREKCAGVPSNPSDVQFAISAEGKHAANALTMGIRGPAVVFFHSISVLLSVVMMISRWLEVYCSPFLPLATEDRPGAGVTRILSLTDSYVGTGRKLRAHVGLRREII